MSKFKVGDQVKVLPFEVHKSNTGRAHLESMLGSIGTVLTVKHVHDDGVMLSDGWNYDFKFASPVNAEVSTESTKSNVEVTMKNVTINVINQSKKVQRKLSAKLGELGYTLDQAWDRSDEFSRSTRIYQAYMNHDLHMESRYPDAIKVNAEGKKFKAVLAEVCSHLGLNTPELNTEVTPEPVSTEVGAYTPVGTKVRLVVDHAHKVSKGAVGVLVRHDGDEQPQVDFKDDFWYPEYFKLEVVPDDTEVTVCHPKAHIEEPKPEVKLQSIKDGNFPVTRVRVKETGAEGVVIGRGRSTSTIGVLHDEPKDSLHNGNGHVKGAAKRTWFYPEHTLEVI